MSIESRAYWNRTQWIWRRDFLNFATSFMVAALLSASPAKAHLDIPKQKEYRFQSRWRDLREVHDTAYDKLIIKMEEVLTHNHVRVTGFSGRILRQCETEPKNKLEICIFTLEYIVKTETVGWDESPHRHIELVSTVWREKWIGKNKSQTEQKVRWERFLRNFSHKYSPSLYSSFTHESGDDDLYQIGTLVVW
jgi:hypothetical protein